MARLGRGDLCLNRSIATFLGGLALLASPLSAQDAKHASGGAHGDQGQPAVVTPGARPTDPPSDAVVLFGGKTVVGWHKQNGKPVAWTVQDGDLVCKPGSGSIISDEKFTDAQLHVEFATPLMPNATGQGRGNSGVYLQGRYELQVLDSFNNPTYANGSCGAIYLKHIPLVNACRPPLEWQTYDIVFHSPKLGPDGKVVKPGRITVLQNGVLIQDGVEVTDACGGELDRKIGTPGPLMLQDHGNLVKYRNIWLRHLSTPTTEAKSTAARK